MAESDSPIMVVVERIEGKIDRMNDRVERTEKSVDMLLDVVTGHKSGAERGLNVRVIDLEHVTKRHENKLNDIGKLDDRMDTMEDKIDEVLTMQRDNPSLLYLLRFNTRKTIMWIIIVFAILSIWYISDFRQPVLQFFGLPIF